jgi:phosphoribosyl-ATP pyrophosphohydrolase
VSTETLGAALDELVATVAERARDLPPGSYTADLLRAGPARALQKLGEEAVEAVIAGTQPDAPRLAAEAADLLFHLVVALAATGVPAADVAAELARRRRRPSRADG